VTNARKIKSNSPKACSSTGPKTAGGRARSARNALRHGLSLPVLSYPVFSEEVEALAREIAGADASLEIHELARQIAEAQIDLRRVRSARHDLLSSVLGDPDVECRASLKAKHELLAPFARGPGMVTSVPDEIIRILEKTPEGPLKLATVLSDMAQRLSAMDRYERRALSRRKFAIRAFDEARRKAVATVCPNTGNYRSDQPS
jgi:hypothetical protein